MLSGPVRGCAVYFTHGATATPGGWCGPCLIGEGTTSHRQWTAFLGPATEGAGCLLMDWQGLDLSWGSGDRTQGAQKLPQDWVVLILARALGCEGRAGLLLVPETQRCNKMFSECMC